MSMRAARIGVNLAVAVFLTVLTQLGGVAWLAARLFPRPLLAFIALYAGLSVAALFVAPMLGRVAITCWASGPLQVQSWFYCALNRTYVTPELHVVLLDLAEDTEATFPGTETLMLDGGFPFGNGFPLLPHLSHDDGRKADIAFYYRDDKGYVAGATPSPIGYFAFEDGPTDCPDAWPTMRWDLEPAQPLWRDLDLEPERTAFALRWLTQDPRVDKVFVEPHLKTSLGVDGDKLRFQGCRAARHDDHIHLQL
ncbi:hypothetical protein ACW9UR_21420 [Halovulum sp. GXIMD14794]